VEIWFCTYSLKLFWKMLICGQFADLTSFFQQFLAILCKNSLPIIQFTKLLLLEKILKILKYIIFSLYHKFLEVTLAHWQQTSESENTDEIRLLKVQKSVSITESQNHRIVGVGRDLCGSSSPTLLPELILLLCLKPQEANVKRSKACSCNTAKSTFYHLGKCACRLSYFTGNSL